MKMHSVPLSVNIVNRETLPVYVEQMKACGVGRVFLCCNGYIYTDTCVLSTRPDDIKYAIDYLHECGFEVGVWLSAFGHGSILVGAQSDIKSDMYTPIRGADGKISMHAFCPLDDDFRRDYFAALKKIASLHPDIIMFDDDFRMNGRDAYYELGCFCDKHLELFCRRVGENIPLEDVAALILTGGKNKYRDAYMEIQAEGLKLFAREARAAVDEIDPDIRMSACTNPENLDFTGTDVVELAHILAGKNKPMTRVFGAPYCNTDISWAIDTAREHFEWLGGTDLEIFSEGDVYPRPRYNCPSKLLELFNYAMVANGKGDGELNYMFDYVQRPDYETGYIDRYLRTKPYREMISEIFSEKTAVGVRVVNYIHKARDMVLPDELIDRAAKKMIYTTDNPAVAPLSRNSIPYGFGDSGYPTLIFGENARHIPLDEIRCGAILDATAAKILSERGIDTGLVSYEAITALNEEYIAERDTVAAVDNGALVALKCSDKAEVITRFLPSKTPSSYRYENAAGQRFFVIAYESYRAAKCPNFLNTYYRQRHIMDAVEWIAGKPLPVVSYKNPNLYTFAAEGDGALSVMLINIHLDDIYDAQIKLSKKYNEIRFINCEGKLDGDTIILKKLSGYDFAAFEVR